MRHDQQDSHADESPVAVGRSGRNAVVVGVDGSSGAVRALRWAQVNTARIGAIQPVAVWRMPWWATSPPAPGAPPPPTGEVFAAKAAETAEAAMVEIPTGQRLPPVVVNGHAGRVLCNVADRAALLVVGSRGRGAIAETILGSTGAFCAAHSTSPVVIVPPSVEPSAAPVRVVVGVDGSMASIAALRWAIDSTNPDIPVVAVHAYTPAGAPFETLEEHDREGILAARARDILDLSIRRAVRHASTELGDRQLTGHILVADPREALIGNADDLVVVGARGHRGVAHLLVGSTTTALVQHLTSATVIVPDRT